MGDKEVVYGKDREGGRKRGREGGREGIIVIASRKLRKEQREGTRSRWKIYKTETLIHPSSSSSPVFLLLSPSLPSSFLPSSSPPSHLLPH